MLFCYDHDEYVGKRGCYIDPAQLQLPMAQTVSALNALLQRDLPCPDPQLRERFVHEDGADACEVDAVDDVLGGQLHRGGDDDHAHAVARDRRDPILPVALEQGQDAVAFFQAEGA